METFKIIPILGRKTNVPPDDLSLFKFLGQGIALTHDVGGINFDITRKKNACSKSYGYSKWANSANAQATKCLGLFELYDGTNRNHIFFDNGKCYVFDSTLDPQVKEDAKLNYDGQTGDFTVGLTVTGGTSGATGVIVRDEDAGTTGTLYLQSVSGTFQDNEAITDTGTGAATVNGNIQTTTFATDNIDLYSILRVGEYMVFSDRGEHMPYKWKHGETNISPLIASGTAYKFRWLVSFQRRIIGLYSDQTNGDIEIRWSTAWPTTAITSLNFPAGNQLYIPNDDSLVGGAIMGYDKCFLYCEDSIQQLTYYPDYTSPFRIYTIIPQQGAVNHYSIVNVGDRHFLFNRNYGFCEYRGGREFPFGGVPISEDIEEDVQGISVEYYNLIVGIYVPLTREVVWTVPMGGTTPDRLFFYNINTKQWRIEDKAMRYINNWRMYSNYTWNNLITDLGGTGAIWANAGLNIWAHYTAIRDRLVYANTDGHLYYQTSEGLDNSDLDGYRIEPIIDFGEPKRKDLLKEIWFDLAYSGDYSIDVYHRGGNTTGEVKNASWTALPSLSHNSPAKPVIYTAQSARLHQIKWGTAVRNARFEVNGITFKYEPQSEN
jgi:hypothetical protein